MTLDPAGLEAAAKAAMASKGSSEACDTGQGDCGGTHTDCYYRSLAADAVRAYLAAAGRAAATPDPPDMTNMCEGESPDHKPGITPAASPDERLREALREIVADFPPTPDRHMDEEEVEQWYADHGDWFQRLSALAAADREKPGQKITHGRHCTCTPCRVEDWTNPALAPCGMHGRDCPREYAPLGGAGQVVPVNEPETATPIPDSEFVEPPLMPSDPISERMIDVADDAFRSGSSDEQAWRECLGDALYAVYPLIREQVMAEASQGKRPVSAGSDGEDR